MSEYVVIDFGTLKSIEMYHEMYQNVQKCTLDLDAYRLNGKLTNRRKNYTQPPNLPARALFGSFNGALDEWFELTRPTTVLMSLF